MVDKQEITEMMRRQADSLRVMSAAMLDYSQAECDEWHTHGIELQCAAGQIESWIVEIEDE